MFPMCLHAKLAWQKHTYKAVVARALIIAVPRSPPLRLVWLAIAHACMSLEENRQRTIPCMAVVWQAVYC